MLLSMLLRQARRILLTALVGGLLGATLVRLGPGFGVDEREFDARLNAQSQQAIRAERARDNNIALFYVRYLSGLVHGDLGFSRSLNRPVSELLKERLPLTLGSLAYGVLGGMSIGARAALALAGSLMPSPAATRVASSSSTLRRLATTLTGTSSSATLDSSKVNEDAICARSLSVCDFQKRRAWL